MTISIGDRLPDVPVTTMAGEARPLSSWAGRALVLYFYPKDDTAGCTREAQDFSAKADEFAELGVELLGISKDTPAKHAKFAAKNGLTVPLATDADGAVLAAFGSWVEKTLYGRKYMGIDRSTFLFDSEARLVREWRKVRVPGHVEAVLDAARDLQTR